MTPIDPSECPEWRASSVSLSLDDDFIWTVVGTIDAALVRLQVRCYGDEYLAEFRCSIGSLAGRWVPVSRFTFWHLDLKMDDGVDTELFPPLATDVFAGLAQFWANARRFWGLDYGPIEYFGELPVYYPLPDDRWQTILPAHPGAAPTVA
jgi:hypothetical protein